MSDPLGSQSPYDRDMMLQMQLIQQLQQKQQEKAAMQRLGPEGRQQLLGLSTIPDQQKLLEEQAAQAQALGSKQYAPVNGLGSGIVTGLSRGLDGFMAGSQQKDVLAQQKALIDELRKGRQAYGNALFDGQGDGQGQGDFLPPTAGGGYG